MSGRRHAQLDDIGERLGDRFDTRVKVSLGANRGRITIDFASVGDLDRILRQLGDDGYQA